MKIVYIALLCMLVTICLRAQRLTEELHASPIDPYLLQVSHVHTTNLIFPYAVRRVHCASTEVEIEQMKDVKNILLVRSMAEGFSPTNLSVVTSDGKFYSFVLHFASSPPMINLKFGEDSLTGIADVGLNEESMQVAAKAVAVQKKFLRLVKRNQQIKLSLDGIFVQNGLMWFALTANNSSLINYPIDYVKVFVRDRTRSRKTIRQEKEMQPVFVKMNDYVSPGRAVKIIMAFRPFTIAFDKMLVIQMAEKAGGRFIELRALNQVFYKVRTIL